MGVALWWESLDSWHQYYWYIKLRVRPCLKPLSCVRKNKTSVCQWLKWIIQICLMMVDTLRLLTCVLSLARGCRDHKISVYLPLRQQRSTDCGRQRKSETTEPICIKWVNASVWKIQSVPNLLHFLVFPPPPRPHTNLFLARSVRHTHTRDPLTFLSPVRHQWEPSCCQTHSLHTERRPGPVKFLKWHYSRQFFSLYLKCLNVWQTNQSCDPDCTSCVVGEKEVKDTNLHPLPTQQDLVYKKTTKTLRIFLL